MKNKILKLLSVALFVVASVISSTACFIWFYQPKVPKCLQK